MSHTSAAHRSLARRYAEALARDGGELTHDHALVVSRNRLKDAWTMNGPPQARVLLATLNECVSGRGSAYLRGWVGASNLVAFRGEDDEQGRPTWNLYLTERQPRDGTPAPQQRAQAREAVDAGLTAPRTSSARPGGSYRAPRPEGDAARRERVSAEIARGLSVHSDNDLNDEIGF